MAPPPPIVVREVWEANLEQEFSEITRALPFHRFAAFDTEFPGEVFPADTRRHYSSWSPTESYLHMKRNVDATKIIQLGLALSNAKGDSCYVWEFNFKGFDKETDLHDLESIQLLEQQGIDLNKNREKGIDYKEFVRLIVNSGLLWNSNITWVTFHGAYDFGYLIKILIGRELPYDLMAFMRLVVYFFGYRVFDIKHIIKSCQGLYGGLERVANTLGVHRVAGKSHQAGSDSLLTLQTIMKLNNAYFMGKFLIHFGLILHTLEVDVGRLIAPKVYGLAGSQFRTGCHQYYQKHTGCHQNYQKHTGCHQNYQKHTGCHQYYQKHIFVPISDGMLPYSI